MLYAVTYRYDQSCKTIATGTTTNSTIAVFDFLSARQQNYISCTDNRCFHYRCDIFKTPMCRMDDKPSICNSLAQNLKNFEKLTSLDGSTANEPTALIFYM